MMVMIGDHISAEIGWLAGRYPGSVGHLYTPQWHKGPYHFMPYALDNGAFITYSNGTEWDAAAWKRLLLWAAMSGQRPAWALVPDVVADRAATLARWGEYSQVVKGYGFRAAFAVQDGMTFADIPDPDCVLFLGGGTEWKEAAIGPWCRQFPGRTHVGRVNTWDRLIDCWRAGAVSVDGTGWYHKKGSQRNDLLRFIRETHAA